MMRSHYFIRAVLCLICGLGICFAQEPQRLPDAAAADCAACHKGKSPLPEKHVATAGLSLKDCLGCHPTGSPASLTGKLPLSHLHQLSGVTCAQCHDNPRDPQPVSKLKCFSCHDPDKLAEATAHARPINPHTSPHYGKRSDCNICHHQHERSENYCAQCHKFDFKVP